MPIRRALIIASMVFFLWAAPAYAQTYGPAAEATDEFVQVDPASDRDALVATGERSDTEAGDNLARTGQNNVLPMTQFAVILVGSGTLLVFVARRRRSASQTPA